MNTTTGEKFNLRDEIELIPKGMYAVAALALLGIEALFVFVVFRHHPHPPALILQVLIGVLPGSVLGFLFLLLGYVNRDAKRRGMNYVLWTILVLFIPNAIGYVIYFVVRQPILGKCPQCGAITNPSFNFCPKCKFNLHPACPQCHRTIEIGAAFCPYCSADLKAIAPAGI
jgi:RNA polymerase subunit RPABC4/transcription elongation factor Spt4